MTAVIWISASLNIIMLVLLFIFFMIDNVREREIKGLISDKEELRAKLKDVYDNQPE